MATIEFDEKTEREVRGNVTALAQDIGMQIIRRMLTPSPAVQDAQIAHAIPAVSAKPKRHRRTRAEVAEARANGEPTPKPRRKKAGSRAKQPTV